jgi:hypothetical protein
MLKDIQKELSQDVINIETEENRLLMEYDKLSEIYLTVSNCFNMLKPISMTSSNMTSSNMTSSTMTSSNNNNTTTSNTNNSTNNTTTTNSTYNTTTSSTTPSENTIVID